MKRVLTLLFALALAAPLTGAAAEWVRIGTADFQLLTTAPEKDGRNLLRRFEQIRGFFQKASPVPAREQFPVRIIAFDTAEQFASFSARASSSAYFVSSRGIDYIVMRDASTESYRDAVHEYVHVLVRHSGMHLPVWVNEGWADVYSTLHSVSDGVAVGDLIEGRMRVLDTDRWLNFETLTSVTTGSKIYNEGDRVGIFYAQSWALVHMLFLAPDYSANFPKFVVELNRGQGAAQAFETAWGRSPQQVSDDLKNYFKRKKLYGRVFEAPLGKAEKDLPVRKMTEFESGLMLADLDLAIGRYPRARLEFAKLAGMQPQDSELSELAVADPAMLIDLGVLRIEARQYESALSALLSIPKVTPEQAPEVFLDIAYCYLQEGDLDKAQARATTAKRWARDPRATTRVEQLLGLIEARSRSPMAPQAGEKTERVEGVLQSVDCSAGRARMTLLAGDKPLVFELPDPKAIEFVQTGGAALKLGCGLQQPVRLTVDYALGVDVVRRIEF